MWSGQVVAEPVGVDLDLCCYEWPVQSRRQCWRDCGTFWVLDQDPGHFLSRGYRTKERSEWMKLKVVISLRYLTLSLKTSIKVNYGFITWWPSHSRGRGYNQFGIGQNRDKRITKNTEWNVNSKTPRSFSQLQILFLETIFGILAKIGQANTTFVKKWF